MAGGVPPRVERNIALYLDRPFAFLARLCSSGLILLAGWVAEPDSFQPHPDQAAWL